MDTISVTSSPYLSTESNKINKRKTLPEKLALREKANKIGQIFTVCHRDFFYNFVCWACMDTREKNTRIRGVLLLHVESCILLLKASSISCLGPTHLLAVERHGYAVETML